MSAQPPPTSHSCDQSRTAHDQPRGAWPAFLNKVASDPRTLITAAGLLLYAVLLTAYVIFYQSFGLTPDDLGWGYLDLLGQAAVATVGLTVLTGALLSLGIVVLRVGSKVWRGEVNKILDRRRKGKDDSRQQGDTGRAPKRGGAHPAGGKRRQWFALALALAVPLAAVAIYFWSLFFGGPLHTVATVGTCCVLAGWWILASVKWFKDLDQPGRERFDRQVLVAMVAALFTYRCGASGSGSFGRARCPGRSKRPSHSVRCALGILGCRAGYGSMG